MYSSKAAKRRNFSDEEDEYIDTTAKPTEKPLNLPRRIDIKVERPELTEELKLSAAKKLKNVFGHKTFLSSQQKVAIMYTLMRKSFIGIY